MRFLFFQLCFFCFLWSYDFGFCQKYYKDGSAPLGDSRVIYVEYKGKKSFIGFFKTPPEDVKILKADPFVGLYSFDLPYKNKPSYMLKPIDSKAMSLNVAGIGFKSIKKGIILENQKGFLNYARFSATLPKNGVISNICYQIYGLGVQEDRFIDSKYLIRFLDQESPYYGDIGVRIYTEDSKQKTLKVEYVDPFFPNNPFLKDDEIISINQKPIKDYYDFEWLVSNLEENSPVQVQIRRTIDKKTQELSFDLKVQKRYGGFLIPDLFFERIGIELNDRLEITDIDLSKQNLQQGLLKGDVILWINGQKIFDYDRKSSQEIAARIRYLLTQAVSLGKLDILISRGGFQFTINLLNGLQNEYIKDRYDPFGL